VVEYATDLFERGTVERLIGHLRTLLEAVAAAPDRRLAELPLLTEPERRQVLVDWNRTEADYPRDRCLHELVAEQAARTPGAVAVAYEDRWLTYAELDVRANQLARYLQGRGVGPDALVALCLERSPEMVVAVLGALKAGGAYLPLDPAYPAERLAFMLADARPRVLLTQERLLGQLPPFAGPTLCLDRDWAAVGALPPTVPPHRARPANLAYVIYTSGSTGSPKGVMIAHRSAVALVAWARGTFAPNELAGVLATTSICFDLSVFELFVPLSAGGMAILANDALGLPSLPAAQEVTLVNTVPSVAAELLRLGALPLSARTVNLAGEALPKPLAEALYRRGTVARLFNLYGPTEDTTYSTYALVKPDVAGAPPIGRPIANTRIYIVDRRGRPVPAGVPGELCIGGVGLARGYLNRPELTAERFVPDPFGPPGARLYRTGDLARYRPDGEIEYLGRLDHQVKIRGFRVEPGEVEAALRQHPAVREAAVVAREDAPGDRRLVAYVVAHPEHAPIAGEQLRALVRGKLPEHMVPSAFVPLDALPLTPNGKLDRRALPAPDGGRPDLAGAFVPPRNAVEEVLAGIWAEVLGLERVGVHDDFFELGGHSLLAVQVIVRLSDIFQVDLPLRSIFETSSLAELAVMLLRRADEQARIERTAKMLLRVAQLSDEQVETTLTEGTFPPDGSGAG
jgi:amino acid adenylation domain-containing protein